MGEPSPADHHAVAAYQMTGQDVGWLLHHWAANKPEHPLLIWEPRDGADKMWTYAQFLADTRSIAAGLVSRGVTKGDCVMIHADNCPEMVLAWYACALVGAVGVTTNTKSAGPEIEYFAGHTRCVAAITQPQYADVVAANATGLRWIAVTPDNSGEPASESRAAEPALMTPRISFAELFGDATTLVDRVAEPMLPAGIMFTSGTTSRPKAVVHTHANALWASRVGPDNIQLSGNDRYLIYTPYFHVNAQSWAMWSALGVGATVVLVPKWSASRFWDVVVKHDITHFSVMGFTMQAIVGKEIPPNALKVGVFGLIQPQLEKMAGIRLTSNWGMTETVTHATRNQFDQVYPPGTMGRPTPGYEFVVVNEAGDICPPGEIGELWVRGRRGIQLFLEYFDNDEANAKAFTSDGWFKTGDRVLVSDEGFLFFKDRDKDALKVGGENVSAKEVEDVCRTVAGIADVAIVGQKHDFFGQVAVAFVIPTSNAPDNLSESIMAACAARLAGFKCPKAVYLVDEFPRATLEKIAKNKLREIADSYVAG